MWIWLPAAIASLTAVGRFARARCALPSASDAGGLAGRQPERPVAERGGQPARAELLRSAGAGATAPSRFPAPGVGRGGDGDGARAPGVLAGAASPVVDVDVPAEDRAAGVAGVERARWCRTGWAARGRSCRSAITRGSTATSMRGRPGGEVQAGRGDPAAFDAAPRRPVGGRHPRPPAATAASRPPGASEQRAAPGLRADREHGEHGEPDEHSAASASVAASSAFTSRSCPVMQTCIV